MDFQTCCALFYEAQSFFFLSLAQRMVHVVKEVDRQRATDLVLKDATQRMLTPAEVRLLRDAVLTADMELSRYRGVALAHIDRLNNGHVVTYAEAEAVALAIERLAAIQPLTEYQFDSGVRDREATCHRCACGTTTCPECSACAFDVSQVGGIQRSSLSVRSMYVRPKSDDCGCGSPVS